ncbi:16015_t:CDS:1, partial [Cetraspora pellucida]
MSHTTINKKIEYLYTNRFNISDIRDEYKKELSETLYLTFSTHRHNDFKNLLNIIDNFPGMYYERCESFKFYTFEDMDIIIDNMLILETEYIKHEKNPNKPFIDNNFKPLE